MKNYSETLARTLMHRYPDPDSFPYVCWSYSQGFMLWGFLRLFENTGDKRYLEYVLRYCDGHVASDGSISGFSGCSLDDIMTGSVLIEAWRKTGEERYRLACERVRRAYDDYPRNSDGGFWHGRSRPGEMWVDGLFMGMMFLTRYGRYIGDAEYCFAETVRQLKIVFTRCEKDGSGLLYHAYSENPEVPWAHPITGKSPEIWSEGLGWYAMILPEVLMLLPEDQPGRDGLVLQLQKLLDGLLKVQDSVCGLWYQVVDKPGFPRNFHDTSGSAMFVYALSKALSLGLIAGKGYEQALQLGWRGLKTKYRIDLEGFADIYDACDGVCVQLNYDIYVDYTRNVNAKEAVAAFLWAAIEMEYSKLHVNK